MPVQLILVTRLTRLQFDKLMSNISEVVFERQISKKYNGSNRVISFNISDIALAKVYWNNNNKWEKRKII